MEKNADYFKDGFKGDPKISKIMFRTIKDANTRAAELMTGAIDWIWDVPKDQAERIKANPAVVVENAKTLRVSYLQFDVARPCRARSSSPTSACARRSRMPSIASRSPRTWSARLRWWRTAPAIPTSSPARATCPSTPTTRPRPRRC